MNSGKTRFQGSSKPEFFPAWARCVHVTVTWARWLCCAVCAPRAGRVLWWAHPWDGGTWGCCTSPWRGMGELPFPTALENPLPEIALYLDFSFLLQVLLLLLLKSRSLKPSCCGGRWDLRGIYSFKAEMCFQLMMSFMWKHYSVAGAEMLSCLCQTFLIKLSTESAKNEAIFLSQLLHENCSVT